MKNIKWEDIMNDKLLVSLIIMLIVVATIILIMSLVVFAIYIKTSWIERENSKNITGGELARKILDEEGMDNVKIKPSYFYIKYWNHSKRKNTFRLRPWTVNRRSIWTMTESAQQTIVSTWRKNNGRMRTAFTIFRIPTIINIASLVISIGLIIYIYLNFHSNGSFSINSPKWRKTIVIFIVGFTFAATLVAWADVVKLSIIKKHVIPILEKQGFTDNEIKLFKLIYTSRLFLIIAIAIYRTLELMTQIATISKGEGGK
ncbi:MAG: zinc metallopeptidase [Mycoplasmatales bacterium]|nr:zinc metallopeptidase [Mycoplasmatales bacterium]